MICKYRNFRPQLTRNLDLHVALNQGWFIFSASPEKCSLLGIKKGIHQHISGLLAVDDSPRVSY